MNASCLSALTSTARLGERDVSVRNSDSVFSKTLSSMTVTLIQNKVPFVVPLGMVMVVLTAR